MKIAAASDDGKTITGHVGKCEMFLNIELSSDNDIQRKLIID